MKCVDRLGVPALGEPRQSEERLGQTTREPVLRDGVCRCLRNTSKNGYLDEKARRAIAVRPVCFGEASAVGELQRKEACYPRRVGSKRR